jgi:hypothetical protein
VELLSEVKRSFAKYFKAQDFGSVRAWSITPAKPLAFEMLLYSGAFRRVTTDTRRVFLFPHFVF